MRFAIRDDDTNYFTSPEVLQNCYADLWDTVTPTLCLISKVKGNWLYWVHQIYKDKQLTDWEAWRTDDDTHPIEHNEILVGFLKEQINIGKLDVGFHAKYHRNEDIHLPTERTNNYIRGAEFFTDRDMTAVIREEVNHLDQLLGSHISIFTPPQNLLSEKGYRSVINAGLNICGGGISIFKKQKDLQGIANLGKQLCFKMMHGSEPYPSVIKFSGHNEIPYHYPLQPNTKIETLIDAFEKVRKYDGDFVLSTHYIEFDYSMTYDSSLTMKDVLKKFLDHIMKYRVDFVSLSTLLK